MNKKQFIGTTLITATVVGAVVYYRHILLKNLNTWLHPEATVDVPVDFPPTPDEVRQARG